MPYIFAEVNVVVTLTVVIVILILTVLSGSVSEDYYVLSKDYNLLVDSYFWNVFIPPGKHGEGKSSLNERLRLLQLGLPQTFSQQKYMACNMPYICMWR
jgi:hypothetical protein